MGEFVKVDIRALSGAALLWAFACALGYNVEAANDTRLRVLEGGVLRGSFMMDDSPVPWYLAKWEPDQNWEQASYYIKKLDFSFSMTFVHGVYFFTDLSSSRRLSYTFDSDVISTALTRCLLAHLCRDYEFLVPRCLVH